MSCKSTLGYIAANFVTFTFTPYSRKRVAPLRINFMLLGCLTPTPTDAFKHKIKDKATNIYFLFTLLNNNLKLLKVL